MADIADKRERWRCCLQAGTAPEGHPPPPSASGLGTSGLHCLGRLASGPGLAFATPGVDRVLQGWEGPGVAGAQYSAPLSCVTLGNEGDGV